MNEFKINFIIIELVLKLAFKNKKILRLTNIFDERRGSAESKKINIFKLR